MSETLRWGILGTGNIARQFCADMRLSHRGRLAAGGSRAIETAREFAAAYGIPVAVDSYAQLVERDDVDAVYISLPNSMHHHWTLAALRAGKHVLCEKPLAGTVAEAEEMFDVARQSGRLLVEAFMYRSHPQTHAVIEAVRNGMIGELKQIRTSFCFCTAHVENNIRFNCDLDGGALMDVGCYCVNFSRLFAGDEPAHLAAYGQFHSSGVDELASGVLQFPTGLIASFTCGMKIQADNTAFLCGTEGYIEIPVPWKPPVENATWRLAYSAPPRMDRAVGLAPGTIPPPQAFKVSASGGLYSLEADDFAASVLDGAPPRITREDSLGTMRTLHALRAAIKRNQH